MQKILTSRPEEHVHEYETSHVFFEAFILIRIWNDLSELLQISVNCLQGPGTVRYNFISGPES